MKFAYEDMGDDQFETLIVFLCQQLLGIGVQGFAKGPDGGRDAKFIGTAELYPSKAAPWVGTIIIQAKHTNSPHGSFSDRKFFNKRSENTVLGKELPRIKNLRANKQLDHYMLFSNRRLTAIAETEIQDHISSQCDIPTSSISLCGVEQLENWLACFPEAADNANLDPIDSPLIVSSDELAEVVEALAFYKEDVNKVLDDPPTRRISYEEKNRINNMSPAYAKEMCRKYLKETTQIRSFLAAPENTHLLHLYESIIDEFQFRIISKRKDYQNFDEVMEYLINMLSNRDPVLRQLTHKRLMRAMLFYMYWNCDIGEVDDVTTDQTLPS